MFMEFKFVNINKQTVKVINEAVSNNINKKQTFPILLKNCCCVCTNQRV